jgi:hypothetical protein
MKKCSNKQRKNYTWQLNRGNLIPNIYCATSYIPVHKSSKKPTVKAEATAHFNKLKI